MRNFDQASNLRKIVNSSNSEGMEDLEAQWVHSQQTKRLYSIAVTSGKGGVGKTNLSVNLGIAMAKYKRVAILDVDLGLANADVLFNINPKYTLKHVLSGEKNLAEIIVEPVSGVNFIPGSSGIEALAVYEVTATGAGTFVNLEPEHELHERLEKILAMLGVSAEDIPVFPQSLDLKARADLINYSNDRAEVVDAYGNGEITETELKETTSEILALAAKYAQPVNTELENLVTLSSGAVPDLELNGVYPDRESGVAISQFVGNELMGSYSTGWVWTFDGEYEFMAQLTQNSATCQVAQ